MAPLDSFTQNLKIREKAERISVFILTATRSFIISPFAQITKQLRAIQR